MSLNLPTISMSVYRRPEYTRDVLNALRDNLGSNKYRLVVAVDQETDPTGREWPNKEIMKLLDAQMWPSEKRIVVMPRHAGCNATIREALDWAFASSEYVIHVEDDVLMAKDALAWFEWAGARFKDDPSVFTVGAWRHPAGWLPDSGRERMPDESTRFRREHFFTCWGWATWADRWREMKAGWSAEDDFKLSWDVRMSQMRTENGVDRVQVVPLISRAINIGAMLGTHRGHAPLDWWRGNETVDAAPQEFAEAA